MSDRGINSQLLPPISTATFEACIHLIRRHVAATTTTASGGAITMASSSPHPPFNPSVPPPRNAASHPSVPPLGITASQPSVSTLSVRAVGLERPPQTGTIYFEVHVKPSPMSQIHSPHSIHIFHTDTSYTMTKNMTLLSLTSPLSLPFQSLEESMRKAMTNE